jgi:hypothetical protein
MIMVALRVRKVGGEGGAEVWAVDFVGEPILSTEADL